MSKLSKILLIIVPILILILNINLVQATEGTIDSNSSAISEENSENGSIENEGSSSLETLSASSVTKVSNINSYDQANLHLNNILSIILISIGVLLILFAIAILIRLKNN